MSSSPPAIFIFPARKVEGSFPVTDGRGQPIAHVTPASGGGRFTVTDLDGQLICQASTRWTSWTGTWQATRADGAPLLSVRPKLLTLKDIATVRLERGGVLILHGNPWGRDFTVHDQHGRTVLTAEPRTSVLSLRQHDYAVSELIPGTLQLPETITVVQIWRLIKKNAALAGAAAGASVSTAGT
jgi:uncharacterized protein YxjI